MMQIWYHNVPHTKLAVVKGHQNWVKVTGEYLTFPGGGTQFKNGALHYIDFIQKVSPIVISSYFPDPVIHWFAEIYFQKFYGKGISFLIPLTAPSNSYIAVGR